MLDQMPRLLTLLAMFWLLSPFVLHTLILHSPRAQRIIARWFFAAHFVGWSAVLALICGMFFLNEANFTYVFFVATPLLVFMLWSRIDSRDDDYNESDHGPTRDLDWDKFDYIRRSWGVKPYPVGSPSQRAPVRTR